MPGRGEGWGEESCHPLQGRRDNVSMQSTSCRAQSGHQHRKVVPGSQMCLTLHQAFVFPHVGNTVVSCEVPSVLCMGLLILQPVGCVAKATLAHLTDTGLTPSDLLVTLLFAAWD